MPQQLAVPAPDLVICGLLAQYVTGKSSCCDRECDAFIKAKSINLIDNSGTVFLASSQDVAGICTRGEVEAGIHDALLKRL